MTPFSMADDDTRCQAEVKPLCLGENCRILLLYVIYIVQLRATRNHLRQLIYSFGCRLILNLKKIFFVLVSETLFLFPYDAFTVMWNQC